MKYFSISILTLMIGAISLVSCSKEETLSNSSTNDIAIEPNDNQSYKSSVVTESLQNAIILQKLASRLDDNFGESASLPAMLQTISFDDALITTFPGESRKCITVPLSGNYSLVSYSIGDDVWAGGFIVETIIVGNSSQVIIHNLFIEEIVGFTAVNGIVQSVSNYGGNPSFLASWYSPWVDCVEGKINDLTSNPILGLGCMAIGPECAGGIAIGCGVIIAFF